ncbi:MAG: hypothetical protein A2X42_02100 [Candidatus Margulisbacteria bacterium GWF2_38_17]|nr:MAG: hypothetical protein A2X43_12650 [Candidatus Margulisbacteria bacterium GWD2_39_127]OGI02903.1 MAG: hypothetical protein A2X42_02100 [Candidatus Margulisbacteria bacterium GWF2_38_17]OGI09662.1 MAG: hypothetical protein A2X41_04810 [Candidatus Margulisbacteria bacterium GWE2_39_32]
MAKRRNGGVHVFKQKDFELKPTNRVLLVFWCKGDENDSDVIRSVLEMSGNQAAEYLSEIMDNYESRHRKYRDVIVRNYQKIVRLRSDENLIPDFLEYDKKLLIGAMFTKEISFENVATFNHSMVPHPDQSSLRDGELRVIVSQRSMGEGQFSTISFVQAIIDSECLIRMENSTLEEEFSSRYATVPSPLMVTRNDLVTAAVNLAVYSEIKYLISIMPDELKCDELEFHFYKLGMQVQLTRSQKEALDLIRLSLEDSYTTEFDSETSLTERVLFPSAPYEAGGMEDARFVRFVHDEGQVTYFATYNAYDGRDAVPSLIETTDFVRFTISKLHGPEIMNKGFALFPEKINGRYAMISRKDGRNIYIMFSYDLYRWGGSALLLQPQWPGIVHMGNCGSPIRTDDGWLLITHDVAWKREYTISAALLDLNDPTKIIGRLPCPLIVAQDEEREGLVPNVVYSCGSLVHNGYLCIPYAVSDSFSRYAKVNLRMVLDTLKQKK